jgi:hypothetical protein
MAEVYEIKNIRQGVFDVVSGTVFKTYDGFQVLITPLSTFI